MSAREVVAVPQVWKRIGCDGRRPSCQKCLQADVECVVSVKLKRKTRPRKFISPEEETIRQLRAEIENLTKREWESQTEISQLRLQVSSSQRELDEQEDQGNEDILVDEPHAGQSFTSSVLGLDFLQEVKRKHQERQPSRTQLSASLRDLHKTPQVSSLKGCSDLTSDHWSGLLPFMGTVEVQPFYQPRIVRFFRRWATIWPILDQELFNAETNRILSLQNTVIVDKSDHDLEILVQLGYILAINSWDDSMSTGPQDTPSYYFRFASQTNARVAMKGTLSTLQSLLLSSLFFQLIGQPNAVVCASGAATRLAYALGLHNEDYHNPSLDSESGLRRRLWFCVYNLDLITSISQGLRSGIDPCAKHNLLPISAVLSTAEDVRSTELTPSKVNEDFLRALTRLSQIGITLLETLYASSKREITRSEFESLSEELHAWELRFRESFMESPRTLSSWEDVHIAVQPPTQQVSHDDKIFVVPYIRLVYLTIKYLLHLPVLTRFSKPTDFNASLQVCADIGREIISLYTEHKRERRLFYLQPSAVKTLFYAALMVIFERLHEDQTAPDHLSRNSVSAAVVLLVRLQEEAACLVDSAAAIGEAISTLQGLYETNSGLEDVTMSGSTTQEAPAAAPASAMANRSDLISFYLV